MVAYDFNIFYKGKIMPDWTNQRVDVRHTLLNQISWNIFWQYLWDTDGMESCQIRKY